MNEKAADRARRIGPTRRARGTRGAKEARRVRFTRNARETSLWSTQHSLIPSVSDGNSMGLSVALVLAEH